MNHIQQTPPQAAAPVVSEIAFHVVVEVNEYTAQAKKKVFAYPPAQNSWGRGRSPMIAIGRRDNPHPRGTTDRLGPPTSRVQAPVARSDRRPRTDLKFRKGI